MLRAKPYHSLQGHLEDAYGVFQWLWTHNAELYKDWCIKNKLDPEEVYRWLGLGVYLHDIGKTNHHWQKYIEPESPKKKHPISHPLLSFAFLWELFTQWEGDSFYLNPLLRSVLTAVLAHHSMLHNSSYKNMNHDDKVSILTESNEILLSFLKSYPCKPFTPFEPEQLEWKGWEIVERIKAIRVSITQLNPKEKKKAKILHTFFLSVICQCDHISSAISESLNSKRELDESKGALKQIDPASIQEWFHQTEIHSDSKIFTSPNSLQQNVLRQISPYMILRAGCGEGKTGAALLFAKHWLKQKKANRVIFTLPTRFTINSMYKDLIHPQNYGFSKDNVGIYHSEALRFLKGIDEEDGAENPSELWKELKSQVYKNNIFQKTIVICTIDHLLYSLLHCHKHADVAFGNLQQAVVIFDELHYYQEYTLQKIGECFKLLKACEIPHLIMSATLPDTFLQKVYKIGKKNPYVLVESNQEVENIPFLIEKARQPLFSAGEGLSNEAISIIEEHKQLRQMIVVNQVERSKAITKQLKQCFPDCNIICYHSEFTPKDRNEKEMIIKLLFKPSKKRTEKEKEELETREFQDNDQVILVSTQICELSLDISADIQLTELAPIDAISQRGGRLHRKGKSPLAEACECEQCLKNRSIPRFAYRQVVFPLETGNKNAGYPYVDQQEWMEKEDHILKRSWDILGERYSFTHVKAWVNQLYGETEWKLSDAKMNQYILEDAVFGKKPADRFGNDQYDGDESEGSFQVRISQYRTVEVVPACYQGEIYKRIRDCHEHPGDVIKDYLVSIKLYRYHQYRNHHFIRNYTINGHSFELLDVPYNKDEVGFDFQKRIR